MGGLEVPYMLRSSKLSISLVRHTLPFYKMYSIDYTYFSKRIKELYDKYADRAMRYLLYLVKNKHDAENIFQDSWIKIIRAIDRFEPGNVWEVVGKYLTVLYNMKSIL